MTEIPNEQKSIIAAALDVQQALISAGLNFYFIGGVALQRWGEPRYTQDVDLTIVCPFGDEDETIGKLNALFRPRIPDAAAFALKKRVFLAFAEDNTPIDISLGAMNFELHCAARATYFELMAGMSLLTCSAADLVIMKAFANRGQDWVDIENVMYKQGSKLDWSIIESELPPLLALKEEPEIFDRLQKLRDKIHT